MIQDLQHQLHLFRTAGFGRKSEKGVVPEEMALQYLLIRWPFRVR
jgi:transposase